MCVHAQYGSKEWSHCQYPAVSSASLSLRAEGIAGSNLSARLIPEHYDEPAGQLPPPAKRTKVDKSHGVQRKQSLAAPAAEFF